jgi:hypothetical protein
MRPLFQALIAEFGKAGAVFSMKQQSVEGEYAVNRFVEERLSVDQLLENVCRKISSPNLDVEQHQQQQSNGLKH